MIFTTRSSTQRYCEDDLPAKNYGCDQDDAKWVANLFTLWKFDELTRIADSKAYGARRVSLERRKP